MHGSGTEVRGLADTTFDAYVGDPGDERVAGGSPRHDVARNHVTEVLDYPARDAEKLMETVVKVASHSPLPNHTLLEMSLSVIIASSLSVLLRILV